MLLIHCCPCLRVQQLDVLLVIALCVAPQRSPRGHCLAALLHRCVPLGFALGAARIDRIDAAFQLSARLVRQLALTSQARARRFDATVVGCSQAEVTTFATRYSYGKEHHGGGGEIRTHERLPVAGFQVGCPLLTTNAPQRDRG